LYPAFDLLIRGDVRRVTTAGLIEHQPTARESGMSWQGKAVASRFTGPNKIAVELVGAVDRIEQQIATPSERERGLWASTIRYQIFRAIGSSNPFERPIASRGSEVYGGAVWSEELFGTDELKRRDYFAGFSLKGLPGFRAAQNFDVTVQPTFFQTMELGQGPRTLPEHWQYATFVTVLYRLVDHENRRELAGLPPLLTFNLVGTFSHSEAATGLEDFENTKTGAAVYAKLVNLGLGGGTTFLASGQYTLRHFAQLGRQDHLVIASFSIGF
jgi:hypothetical protein